MHKFFIHNAFFRIGSGPIFGVLVYLLIILINNTVEQVNEIFNNQELYVCIVLSYISLESMRVVILLTDKRLKKEPSLQTRVVYQIILTLLVSLTLVGIAISAYYRWVVGFSIGSTELNLFLLIYAAGGMLYNILYLSQVFLFRENKIKIEEERNLRASLESEFTSFRNDVNPDLLYESLESLILTIHRDADLAEEFIDNLAGIYRHSIINRNKELVSYEEELKAAHYLISILSFRFPEQIRLETNIDDARMMVIPGSLVVSIDNVVRNTLISRHAPLILRLYVEDDYLVLNHTINDKLLVHEDSTKSFERLQRAYSFFSEKPFIQVKANKENYIKFPIVRVASGQPVEINA